MRHPEGAADRFGELYAALFDKTVETNPGAVVTEYSWDAQSCDPCPTPALNPGDLLTLGADTLTPAERPVTDPTLVATVKVGPIAGVGVPLTERVISMRQRQFEQCYFAALKQQLESNPKEPR